MASGGDEILTGKVILKMSKKIKPSEVSPEDFSALLDFKDASGEHAHIMANNSLNQSGAYSKLLHQFINRHGTRKETALLLRKILRDNDMAPVAEILEDELKGRGIPFFDVEKVPTLPDTPSQAPGQDEASSSTQKGVAEGEPVKK